MTTEWWLQFVQPEHFEDIRESAKLLLLFEILKESEQIGDKVYVYLVSNFLVNNFHIAIIYYCITHYLIGSYSLNLYILSP